MVDINIHIKQMVNIDKQRLQLPEKIRLDYLTQFCCEETFFPHFAL